MKKSIIKPSLPFSTTKKEVLAFIRSMWLSNVISNNDIKTPKDALNKLKSLTPVISNSDTPTVFNSKWLTDRFTLEDLKESNFYMDGTVEAKEIVTSNCIYLFGNASFTQHYENNQYIRFRLFDNAKAELYVDDVATVRIESYDNSYVQVEGFKLSNIILMSENNSSSYVTGDSQCSINLSVNDASKSDIELHGMTSIDANLSGVSSAKISCFSPAPVLSGTVTKGVNCNLSIETHSPNLYIKSKE
jgi:hypothetical protein